MIEHIAVVLSLLRDDQHAYNDDSYAQPPLPFGLAWVCPNKDAYIRLSTLSQDTRQLGPLETISDPPFGEYILGSLRTLLNLLTEIAYV